MTWPLFTSETQVLVQGITGKEGVRMTAWMRASGTAVVAGIRPGKAGSVVEGCSVFNTVREARAAFPTAVTSCIVVPATGVYAAAEEAVTAGVTTLYILTEGVPVQDTAALRRLASTHGITVIGPSSVGYLQFPAFRLGYLGGQHPFASLREGGLAILSGSGGMANETLMACAARGVGVRLALATGGDTLPGFSLIDAVHMAEASPGVSAIAVFMEPGNTLITNLIQRKIVVRKPLVICLPGDALTALPRGVPYGHTGTILGEDAAPVAETRVQLTALGYRCTGVYDEFLDWCASV